MSVIATPPELIHILTELSKQNSLIALRANSLLASLEDNLNSIAEVIAEELGVVVSPIDINIDHGGDSGILCYTAAFSQGFPGQARPEILNRVDPDADWD